MKTESTTEPTGVLARLQAHRAASEGMENFTLPSTGVSLSYPKFRQYEDWNKAQQLAGNDAGSINLYYIVAVCRFDGEQIKANDYRELVPADDHLFISGKMFGGAPAKDVAGNG